MDLQSLLFSFAGRIPRRAWWAVWAVCVGINVAVGFVTAIILGSESGLGGIVRLAVAIPIIWIALATQVKRWHDRGKSGWWVLLFFLPVIGWVWAFVEVCCLRGTVGPNNYGPDPT